MLRVAGQRSSRASLFRDSRCAHVCARPTCAQDAHKILKAGTLATYRATTPANTDAWTLEPHCNASCTGMAPYCGDSAVDLLASRVTTVSTIAMLGPCRRTATLVALAVRPLATCCRVQPPVPTQVFPTPPYPSYPQLFSQAFGDSQITGARIAFAIAT